MPEEKAVAPPGEAMDISRMPALAERQIVQGIVVRVDSDGVLVDVGAKSEGFIPPKELSARGDVVEGIAVGDRIDVYVLKVEGDEGNILLSKKRADLALAWDRIQRAFETGTVLHAMVVDKVKGGLVVDLGMRGFVPGSHVDLSQVPDWERSLQLTLTENAIAGAAGVRPRGPEHEDVERRLARHRPTQSRHFSGAKRRRTLGTWRLPGPVAVHPRGRHRRRRRSSAAWAPAHRAPRAHRTPPPRR